MGGKLKVETVLLTMSILRLKYYVREGQSIHPIEGSLAIEDEGLSKPRVLIIHFKVSQTIPVVSPLRFGF
jgi:hypothetical protein